MKTITALPLLLLTASCSLLPARRIYVSVSGNDQNPGTRNKPCMSLISAQKTVKLYRAQHPKRDIRVVLGDGTWYLNAPLTFSAEDGGSGQASVVWTGQSPAKTIICGGKTITGFSDAGYGIWWAPVEPGLYFEQLYIDDIRAVRARIPNATDTMPRIYLNKSTWMHYPDSTVKNITVSVRDRDLFEGIQPVGEFEAEFFKDWTVSRFRVSFLNADPAEIYLKPPFALFDGPYNSIFAGNANRYSLFLQGDPAFLDEPGEWALDRQANRLYYKPLPGQAPGQVEVLAPVAEQLVIMKGECGGPIENFEFRNIRFEGCAYRLPEFNHDGMQAGFYYPANTEATGRAGLVNPAIQMEWARNCRITDCRLVHVGGNGIYLREGCRDNRIENTYIEDIGATGVMIGLTFDPKADSLLLPTNNIVTGCTVHQAGVAFQGAVGVWLGFCAGNEISGCEVYDLPYTGISVGWQWNPLPTSSKDNRILNNRIHHAMQVLGDGGGIYTLGFQPGSVIAGNDIHDILRSELNHASDNNGMFIDEGSKGYRVENNTIRNTAHTCIRGHRAAGVELTGNTFYSGDKAAVSHTPPYNAMIFVNKDTTVTWKNPGWPKEWGYPDTIIAFVMKNNTFKK